MDNRAQSMMWKRISQQFAMLILVLVLSALIAADGSSECLLPEPQDKLIVIKNCRMVDVTEEKKLMDFARRYPLSFVESTRPQFEAEARRIVDSYRGAVIEEEGGEGRLNRYFYASFEPDVCLQFPSGAQLQAVVANACCDGDSNPPCFLGFSEFIVLK